MTPQQNEGFILKLEAKMEELKLNKKYQEELLKVCSTLVPKLQEISVLDNIHCSSVQDNNELKEKDISMKSEYIRCCRSERKSSFGGITSKSLIHIYGHEFTKRRHSIPTKKDNNNGRKLRPKIIFDRAMNGKRVVKGDKNSRIISFNIEDSSISLGISPTEEEYKVSNKKEPHIDDIDIKEYNLRGTFDMQKDEYLELENEENKVKAVEIFSREDEMVNDPITEEMKPIHASHKSSIIRLPNTAHKSHVSISKAFNNKSGYVCYTNTHDNLWDNEMSKDKSQ